MVKELKKCYFFSLHLGIDIHNYVDFNTFLQAGS